MESNDHRLIALALAIAIAPSAIVGCKKQRESAPAPAKAGAKDAAPAADQPPAAGTDSPAPDKPRGPTRLDLAGDLLPDGAIARLGSVRFLDRALQRLVFTPDGSHVISNAENAYVVWDAQTGHEQRRIDLDAANWPMAVSPDGKLLAGAVLGNGKLRLINVASGKVEAEVDGRAGEIRALCWSGPERVVTGSEDAAVVIWKTKGEPVAERTLTGDWKAVTAIACSARTSIVAWGSRDGRIYLANAQGKVISLGKARNAVNAVAISPDGAYIAAGSSDDVLRIWKTADPAVPVDVVAHDRKVFSAVFSPDSKILYTTGGDPQFRGWNPATGELVLELPGVEKLHAQLMTLSPDGKRIASWSEYAQGRGTEGGRWWLWEADTGKPVGELDRHRESIGAIVYSPDGATIATGSDDRTVRTWDAITGKSLAASGDQGGRVRAIRFAPDGKSVMLSGEFAKLARWKLGGAGTDIISEPVGGEVVGFDVSPDGKTVVTGDEIGRVWTIDASTGKKLRAHDKGVYSAITGVAFTRDGKNVIISGRDSAILIGDAANAAEVAKLQPSDTVSNFAVTVSPDGGLLASAGDDGRVRLWSVAPWKELRVLEGHDGTVRAVAFSADGKRVVSGGNDGTVRVWDAGSGTELAAFSGHKGAVNAVAFAPDGKTVASGGQDTTGLVWKLP